MTPEAEFDDFYRTEYPRLAAALRLASGGDRRAGEDLAQEAMIRAWSHWKRVRLLDRPAGWLYATGFNLVRRQARRRAHPPESTPTASADQYAASDARLALEEAVVGLPLPQRKAVVARHVLGLSTVEAATALGLSPDALRASLHRAVTALRVSPALATTEDR